MISLLATVTVLLGATLWTGDGEPQTDQTIVIRDSRIAEVGRNLSIPAGSRRIELDGAIVTPGLVDLGSTLDRDDADQPEKATEPWNNPIRAAIRASDGFDANTRALSMARAEGVTAAVVFPPGGIVSGQAAWVSLEPERVVRNDSVALVARIPASDDAGATRERVRGFETLREALEDARLYRGPGNRGAYIRGSLRKLAPSADDLEALARALEGGLRVVVAVDRAADILTVLALLDDQKLDGVLLGAREGWRVAREIARAKVPVVVDALPDPEHGSSLLTRRDNASRLRAAGVEVAFMHAGTAAGATWLREAVGNAIADGFPRAAALRAVSRTPADIFGIRDEGRIQSGARANLVVWNGDPFEATHWPIHVFIGGREVSLATRADQLAERYRDAIERAR